MGLDEEWSLVVMQPLGIVVDHEIIRGKLSIVLDVMFINVVVDAKLS